MNRILRDPFYCGRLEDGTTFPQLEALRLRSNDTYDWIRYIPVCIWTKGSTGEILRYETVTMVEHAAVNRGVVGSSPTRGV